MIEELLRKFQNDAMACGADEYNESSSFASMKRREERMEESKKAVLDYVKTLGKQDTQPAEQPSETCKWKRSNSCAVNGFLNPHTGDEWFFQTISILRCPTCGLKIEVVE